MDGTATATRRIRVCLVAPAHLLGGHRTAILEMMAGFAGDPEVDLELLPIDPRIPGWLARIRGARTLVRWSIFLWGLVRESGRADVVHVLTAGFGPFILFTTPAVLLSRARRTPVIVNYHDGRARDHLRSGWVRSLLGRADALAYPSSFLLEVFREHGLGGEVVFNTVDRERCRFRERVPLRPVLISTRQLEELYDIENTIRAFSLLRDEWPDAELMILGSGSQEVALQGLVDELGLGGVTFAGNVPHDDIGAWLDRADILVNSSRIDNMPFAIIEAFAAGLPVVSTDVGGIPLVVEPERNGLLVPPGRPEALAAAISRLLRDPNLVERVVKGAVEDVELHYSWPAADQGWRRLYRRLSGPGREV